MTEIKFPSLARTDIAEYSLVSDGLLCFDEFYRGYTNKFVSRYLVERHHNESYTRAVLAYHVGDVCASLVTHVMKNPSLLTEWKYYSLLSQMSPSRFGGDLDLSTNKLINALVAYKSKANKTGYFSLRDQAISYSPRKADSRTWFSIPSDFEPTPDSIIKLINSTDDNNASRLDDGVFHNAATYDRLRSYLDIHFDIQSETVEKRFDMHYSDDNAITSLVQLAEACKHISHCQTVMSCFENNVKNKSLQSA